MVRSKASGIGRSRKKTVAKTIALMDDYFKETGDAMEDYSFRVGFGYDIEEGKEYYNTVANHIYGESHVESGGNLPDWGNHCGTYRTICDWNRVC